MEWFSSIISLLSVLASTTLSIFTIISQSKINRDNNNRLIESEKINNENQLKLKRLDYYYSQKNSAISKYLECLFNYLDNQSTENLRNYQISVSIASMYAYSKELYDKISYINYLIDENMIDVLKKEALRELIDALISDSQQNK